MTGWVAGTLTPDESGVFEEHLVLCPACQAAVREAAVVRGALRATPARTSRSRRWVIPVGIAAALAAVVLWPRDPLSDVAGLGRPPAFEGLAVRGGDAVGSRADRGMAQYAAGDYAGAVVLLGEVWREEPSQAVGFYLGVSHLWSGREREAVTVLQAVAADSLGPYAGEAALLLAKALVRVGAMDSSLTVLDGMAVRSPAHASAARALADSIRTVRVR